MDAATTVNQDVIEPLRTAFGSAILNAVEQSPGDPAITVGHDQLLAIARSLRDDHHFDMMTDVTAIDGLWLHEQPRFTAIWQLYDTIHNRKLRLRVPAPGGDAPHVPSLTPLWPGAGFPERETYDLLGIRYDGHPDLRRILMPDHWQGHPLRKDYPIGGESVPFTVTWDDPEFASLGQQILPAVSLPPTLPKGMDTTKHMVINMGPHHPSTHGVLRLVVELDGETVVRVVPDLGYLHSGFEKSGEDKRYKDFVYYTDRMDYTASMTNNLAYVVAVERMLDLEIPPRAQAIRVIMAELQRIAAHLLGLGTHVLDLSGPIMSFLMYAFREREIILDLFEMVSGARLTTSYIRVGGVWQDLPPAFVARVRDFLSWMPGRIDDYERMLTNSPVWKARTEGVGILSPAAAIALSCTGPVLRGSGVKYDIRKARPYCGYENYDFEVPTSELGDSYGRFLVRIAELRQSLRIIQQAVDSLPDGPYKTSDRKVALPPRSELDRSMESLIHHFKLVTEGFHVPPIEIYSTIESPKGEHGYFIKSDGGPKPYRLHVRGPSFIHMQALDTMARGRMIADLVACIGTLDPVLGDVDR